MSSREEQQEEYNLLRIEALEGKVKELGSKVKELELKLELENENKRLIVTELESHLRDALDQGFQFKV